MNLNEIWDDSKPETICKVVHSPVWCGWLTLELLWIPEVQFIYFLLQTTATVLLLPPLSEILWHQSGSVQVQWVSQLSMTAVISRHHSHYKAWFIKLYQLHAIALQSPLRALCCHLSVHLFPAFLSFPVPSSCHTTVCCFWVKRKYGPGRRAFDWGGTEALVLSFRRGWLWPEKQTQNINQTVNNFHRPFQEPHTPLVFWRWGALRHSILMQNFERFTTGSRQQRTSGVKLAQYYKHGLSLKNLFDEAMISCDQQDTYSIRGPELSN